MPRGQLDPVVQHLRQVAGLPAPAELTDAQLVDRYVSCRDRDAFATLVARHGPLVRSVCRHVLPQQQDIDDAFQVAFLVFASRAATILKSTSLAICLHGAAYRTSIVAWRA